MLLLCALVILLSDLIPSGSAINCYECNSQFDDLCNTVPAGPPNENDEQYRKFYQDCDMKGDHFTYKLCRKQVQTIEGKDRVIRTCGIEKSQKDCYSTANPPVKTYVCQCEEDGCNSAPGALSGERLLPILITFGACLLFVTNKYL